MPRSYFHVIAYAVFMLLESHLLAPCFQNGISLNDYAELLVADYRIIRRVKQFLPESATELTGRLVVIRIAEHYLAYRQSLDARTCFERRAVRDLLNPPMVVKKRYRRRENMHPTQLIQHV